jgi:hypothetical protein
VSLGERSGGTARLWDVARHRGRRFTAALGGSAARVTCSVAVLSVVTGCGAPAATEVVAQDPLAEVLAAAPQRPMPSQLVGQWSVDAADAPPGLVVNLDAMREIRIFLRCGTMDGSFDARPGGAFVGDIFGGSGDCFPDTYDGFRSVVPRWLTAASGFVVLGKTRQLLDHGGQVVATLSPSTRRPYVPPTVADDAADGPSLTAEDKTTLDTEPAPIPNGLRPATRAELLGRWVPQGVPAGGWVAGEPDLEFRADGTYTGSDGCNGYSGRWSSVNSEVLSTTGPTHLAGCENIVLLYGTTAAFDGDVLVLLDATGNVLRRMIRRDVA